jgi:U3 small nucleolar RNA-associated protein 25
LVSVDEDEDEAPPPPFLTLMKSLSENAAHKSKRRKLDHVPSGTTLVVDPPSTTLADEVQVDQDAPEEPSKLAEDSEDEIASDDDDQELPDILDPFKTHFSEPKETDVAKKIKAIQMDDWHAKKSLVESSRMLFTLPTIADADGFTPPAPILRPSELSLKKKLSDAATAQRATLDYTEQKIAPLLFQYYDTLFCERTVSNGPSLRRLACLHAVNHLSKTRDRVLKNNVKAAKAEDIDDLEIRDQGFTRPKVLILLPTRHACVKMVDQLCAVAQPKQQENRKRFEESYIEKDQNFGDDKPADFRELFAGNDDDVFRLGLKFTRTTVKYFSQFYNSDIILASPLGLRMAIGSEEGDEKAAQHEDYDFLSSIEMVIMDQADAILMQNWDHVEYVFERLNDKVKDAHDADFTRVREWYLDNNSKYYRQTIIFTHFNTPEISDLVRRHCHNWAGKVKVQPEYPGVIGQLEVKARQTFSRLESTSVERDPEARFSYFTKAIIPSLLRRAKDSAGTLIFIPSYLDFVRVRNYFATNDAVVSLSFGTISEYAEVSEASRARSHFMNGRHRVLLYTERAHHFRRYALKGVRRVIFYGLPDNPIFYKEIAGGFLGKSVQNLKLEPGQGNVRVIFSKLDGLKLERIVGSHRVSKMLHEKSDTFVFGEDKAR